MLAPGQSAPSPLAVLRLLRADRHPFALTGAWAGGRAVLGSEPVTVRAPRQPSSRTCSAGPAAGGGGSAEAASGAAFGGGWIGYLGYGLGRQLHAATTRTRGPRHAAGVVVRLLRPRARARPRKRAPGPSRRWSRRNERAAHRRPGSPSSAARLSAARTRPPAPYQCGEFEVTPAPGRSPAGGRPRRRADPRGRPVPGEHHAAPRG